MNAIAPNIAAAQADLEVEQTLLGVLLYDNGAYERLGDLLTPDHFLEPLHGRLFAAIEATIREGRAADPLTIGVRFTEDVAFNELGGLRFLADLVDHAPPPSSAPEYARLIVDAGGRRALLAVLAETSAKLRDPDGGDFPTILADLEQGAAAVAKAGDTAERWLNPSDMIGEAIAHAQASRGIMEFPSGIPDLDRLLGGLHRKEVTILAARSGMGKTVGAQVFAKATASAGKATLFFSLEMGGGPMGLRLACDLAYDRDAVMFSGQSSNISLEKIGRNELSPHQWARLDETRQIAGSWPLRYDDRPGLTMARIEAMARRQFRAFERRGIEPGLIVIDHLGKVKPSRDRKGNKHAETADISSDASEMAKRLDVPVLLLCQLNRQVEGRPDKMPMLSDLRQAGEIEEDARQVVFLYRPEYYLRTPADAESPTERIEREAKLDEVRNKLFWIVEKNSNGPRGQALTFCDMAASAVREWRY